MVQNFNSSYFSLVLKQWARLCFRYCWIFFLIAVITLYNHLQIFDRFHLHLKVVVGHQNEMTDRHENNLTVPGLPSRENIWIHIASRPDDMSSSVKQNLESKFLNSKEMKILQHNSSEVRLVQKKESVSEKKPEMSSKKLNYDDYQVPGWPPEVSRNVTHYINVDGQDSPLLKPKLGPIMPRNKLAFSIVIATQSAPKNSDERREVRTTWGKTCNEQPWCRLIFVIGKSDNNTIQERIMEEQQVFEDILQEDFVDSYNNLTLKSILTLKYYSMLNKDKLLLLKTDDDSFVHIAGLKILLESQFHNPIRPVFVGYLQKGLKKYKGLPLVHRPGLLATSTLKHHKEWERWLVPKYMYDKQFFPQFLSGSGYIMSLKVAECLLQKSKEIPIIHLEDVYVTGLCAEACKIGRKHHSGFKPRGLDKNKIKLMKTDVVIHRTTGLMSQLQQLESPTSIGSNAV